MKNRIKVLLIAAVCAVTLCACGEAKKVTETIGSLGEITLESGDAIEAAENAYAGTIVNGSGTIDFSKFKKGKALDFSDFKAEDSSGEMTDAQREIFHNLAAGMLSPMGVFACEGLQQFINEQDLRISIHELGMDKYELQFAKDPS